MRNIIEVANGVTRIEAYRMNEPVTVSIPSDEPLAIIGENGSGKSLLVDILTGAHPLWGTEVKYDFTPSVHKKVSENIKTVTFRDAYGNATGTYYQQRWNQWDVGDSNTVEEVLSNAAASKDISEELNRILRHEIYDSYNISESVKKLVDVDININGVLSIAKNICGVENLPLNLRRLVMLENLNRYDEISIRERYDLLFPVEKVVLCEGITEEILLPEFAALYGYDFNKYGVKLLGAGGKNQVVKMYSELKNELKLPIFILLDADAKTSADMISPILRSCDSIYLIKHGEFEDIFSLNLIKRTINKRYKNICESTISDFRSNSSMTKVLSEFFRIHELGDFQKAEFAKELASNLKYATDLTEEIKEIIEGIKKM